MPKIIHYRNKCIGCGICHDQQPALWRMSKKDGKATLLNGIEKKHVYILEIPDAVVAHAQGIAGACPVRVIKVL